CVDEGAQRVLRYPALASKIYPLDNVFAYRGRLCLLHVGRWSGLFRPLRNVLKRILLRRRLLRTRLGWRLLGRFLRRILRRSWILWRRSLLGRSPESPRCWNQSD